MKKCLIFVSLLASCSKVNNYPPDELFFKNAEIIELKRDDDAEYHLLIKYENGIVEGFADMNCKIKMGNYKPHASMPFVRFYNGEKEGVFEAWGLNSTDFSLIEPIIYLPKDFKIELIND